MKKIVLSMALCSTLALGACTAVEVDARIAEVQAYTRLACKFLPTVSTVAKILAGGFGVVQTAGAVGDAICAAVTTAPLADGPGDRTPRVNGVAVKGTFVK